MPRIKSSGSAAPLAICVRAFSHSAVSCGEVSISGRTQTRLLPFLVGISCLPLRCTKPDLTSFSITAARVAGVPSPRRSASGSVSALPARSIAESRLASVCGFGGCVSCAVTLAAGLSKLCPSAKVGTSKISSFSSSPSASGFPFSVTR